MLKQIPSLDSASDFEKVWREMDEIEPLTPIPPSQKTELENSYNAYKEAAAADDFLFGDYDYVSEWNNQWEE